MTVDYASILQRCESRPVLQNLYITVEHAWYVDGIDVLYIIQQAHS